jgi:hypothetical protein
LIEGGQQVFSGAISGLETVGGNIAEAAKKTIKNAGKSFGKFGGKLQSGFGGIIGKFIADRFSSVDDTIPYLLSSAYNIISKIIQSITNFGSEINSSSSKFTKLIRY